MSGKPLSREEYELWLLLETQAGVDSLLDFSTMLTPQFMRPNHLRPLAEQLARTEFEPVRACLSVPVRHGKSELLFVYIAWILLRRPDWLIAYLTYSTDFAHSQSRRARDLATAAGVKLRKDATSLGEWRTPQGGGVIATGIGGPITGRGFHVILLDDPHQNRADASSLTIRDTVWEFVRGTAMSRLHPSGSAILNMARWHPDDVVGRVESLKDPRWKIINMPAISDDGKALWPEVRPLEVLEQSRKDVGEYEFSSLYQGRPVPKGAQLFDEPVRYEHPEVENARFVIAADPAATEKTSADFSAIVVACAKGVGTEQVVDILDVHRCQVTVPKLVEKLLELQKKWQAPVAIEAVAGFKAIPDMLRAVSPSIRILPITPKGDKHTRAIPVAAAWNNGRVRVPMYAHWLPDFMTEVLSFTGLKDRFDDQVDALAHAFTTLQQNVNPIRRGVQIATHLPFG